MTDTVYDSQAYRRSRGAYKAQCTFEYLVSILVADAFLAKLLTHIGISDSVIGIISSLITLAFLFQLLSIILVNKINNVKKCVIVFDTLSQFFFLSLYFVPFLPLSTGVKTAIVVVAVLFAYVFKYLILSICFKWGNSFVHPEKRGVFSATKEMISLVVGIVFTLVVGYVVEIYEVNSNITGGFLLIAALMLILNVCNFVSLLLIKNEKREAVQHPTWRDVWKNTVKNKNFMNIVILTVLWDVARYLTVGFLGVYKTNDLLLSLGTVQVINMVANVCRLGVSIPLGKYSDKYSFAKGFNLAMVLAAIAFAFNMFTTPSSWWCIVAYTIFYYCSVAGTNQNSFNMTYSYVPDAYIVQAMAIKNSIGGIFGFAASLLGGAILSAVQANGNRVMGVPLYGQQLLSGLSLIVLVVAILFNHFVIQKQKVMKQ